MLGLSRKKNEAIRIGDDIVVYVTEIRGDKVRLAFKAPKDVPIYREEIYQTKQQVPGAVPRENLPTK